MIGRGVLPRVPFRKKGVSTSLTLIKKEEPGFRNDLTVCDIHGVLGADSILEQLDLVGACRARVARAKKEKLETEKQVQVKGEEKKGPMKEVKGEDVGRRPRSWQNKWVGKSLFIHIEGRGHRANFRRLRGDEVIHRGGVI